MKHIHLSINNYQYFREIFEGLKEANRVTDNLKQAIANTSMDETAPHLNLRYWVHYDDEGFAGFEVNRVIFGKNTIFVNVEFISTANKTIMELNIDIKSHDSAWANVEINPNSCLVGMYEDRKIARRLFLMDREQAAQLAKILNAFANNQI